MSAFTYHNVRHHDASSSNSDSDPFESFEPYQDRSPRSRPLLPAIPDLRFEQSYLKSIKTFIHVEEDSEELRVVDEKRKGKAKAEHSQDQNTRVDATFRRDVTPIVDSLHHLVGIEWGNVFWVTTRDQVISPLLQGALWGVASHFLRPLMLSVGSHIRGRLPSFSPSQSKESGWWKWWTHGLGLGSAGGVAGRTSMESS